MPHPLLYEINTRCWLGELSEKRGGRVTLSDIPESEFEFWQHHGFTHIWLMGVWTLGRRGREHSKRALAAGADKSSSKDVAGSPYAITGHAVSRSLGGNRALADFRRKLNARGIKLVLDFIPNHTAIDHPWVKAQPEFYVTSETRRPGTIRPYYGSSRWFAHGHCGHGEPWMDTLQLEYRNPALRRAMFDELLSIMGKCDGVRCDMAMLVLNEVFDRTWREFPVRVEDAGAASMEFWCEAIRVVREQRSDFLLLAEVYWDLEMRLQELGFDFTYDKRLYDLIIARAPSRIADYLQSRPPEFLGRSAHFIENHDEARIASLLPLAEHRAAALLTLALPGMRFLHEGQLSGAGVHAHVHFARRARENGDPSVKEFYDRLLGAVARSAIGRGEWKLLLPQNVSTDNLTSGHFILVQWQARPDEFDLAVINCSSARSQCFAPLDISGLADGQWRLIDSLSDEVYERSGADLENRGLYLDLPPHGAQLFHGERIQ